MIVLCYENMKHMKREKQKIYTTVFHENKIHNKIILYCELYKLLLDKMSKCLKILVKDLQGAENYQKKFFMKNHD